MHQIIKWYSLQPSAARAFGDSETNDTDAESGTEFLVSANQNDVAMASGSAGAVDCIPNELMMQRIMDMTHCYVGDMANL